MITYIVIGVVLICVAVGVIIAGRKKGAQNAASASDVENEMRYMKATPISDAIDVIKQMEASSPGYRHYTEVNATSGSDSPVVGPYSKQQVAYYEVKCYQVIRSDGGNEEKLLAHEKSFSPFFITDGSCDTKVYVDMESFGDNTLLINSCDRMEGPNSEFAQQALGLTSSSTQPFAANMVEDDPRIVQPDFSDSPRRSKTRKGPQGTSVLARVGIVLASGFFDILSGMAGILDPGHNVSKRQHTLAYAGAGADYTHSRNSSHDDNFTYAAPGPGFGGPGGFGGGPGGFGGGPGGFGGGRPPGMGGGGGDLGSAIGGLVIGTMLASLLSQSTEGDNVNPETFLGYRIVENIIPLNTTVYSIGDIYKAGDRYCLGKTLGENAEASYFSARPEEEVIETMKKRKVTPQNSMGCGIALIVIAILVIVFGIYTMSSGYYGYY